MNNDECLLKPGESIDEFFCGHTRIIQAHDGYRFSLDPVLLCAFAVISPVEFVADLGTGTGVIPVLLSTQQKGVKIVGLERQPAMADRALRNVVLNGLHGRVDIIQGDVRRLPKDLPLGGFDVVISNPPYRSVSSGRVSLNNERAAARHETSGGLSDFLRAAEQLLKNQGRFYLVFLAERLTEVLVRMQEQRIEPKRLRMVHSRISEVARLVLVEGRKNGRPGMKVESSLIIYRGQGRDYTEEVLAMYGDSGCGTGDSGRVIRDSKVSPPPQLQLSKASSA